MLLPPGARKNHLNSAHSWAPLQRARISPAREGPRNLHEQAAPGDSEVEVQDPALRHTLLKGSGVAGPQDHAKGLENAGLPAPPPALPVRWVWRGHGIRMFNK